ncbi:MAG: hypothetical protein ACLTMP_10265 [Eggerthella lenta]
MMPEVTVWPTSKGFPMAKWMADLELRGVAETDEGSCFRRKSDEGKVGFGVAAYQHGFSLSAVGQVDIESLIEATTW